MRFPVDDHRLGLISERAIEPEVSDAMLVAAARSDPQQFGRLYERYIDHIYRYIACRVATTADAEDLVASVFLRALHGIPAYQGRGSFQSWLFSIAHHAVVDHYRKRRRIPIVALMEGAAELADTFPGPERRLLDQDRLAQVTHVWRQLPPDQQAALALKFSAALTNQEIGRVLGKSEGAVKLLIYRGMQVIRRECGGDA